MKRRVYSGVEREDERMLVGGVEKTQVAKTHLRAKSEVFPVLELFLR